MPTREYAESDEEEEPDIDDRSSESIEFDEFYSGLEPAGFLSDLIPNWFRSKVDEIIPGDQSDPGTFEAFFASLDLKHFQPQELLRMGGSNKSGECSGLNSLPEKVLWPNIVPTIKALDKLRSSLGYGIYTTSVYRAPPYNECLRNVLKNGAAKHSQHLVFNAIDFKGSSGSPAEWHNALLGLKAQNTDLGIWAKPYATFVHIDTRFFT